MTVLEGVFDITIGHDHACALDAAGRARCWGANANGALGDSTTSSRPLPVPVALACP